jgi:hypothetical protein
MVVTGPVLEEPEPPEGGEGLLSVWVPPPEPPEPPPVEPPPLDPPPVEPPPPEPPPPELDPPPSEPAPPEPPPDPEPPPPEPAPVELPPLELPLEPVAPPEGPLGLGPELGEEGAGTCTVVLVGAVPLGTGAEERRGDLECVRAEPLEPGMAMCRCTVRRAAERCAAEDGEEEPVWAVPVVGAPRCTATMAPGAVSAATSRLAAALAPCAWV